MSFAAGESELRPVRSLLLVGQFAFQLSSLQAGQ
jgi:hypothetical protein